MGDSFGYKPFKDRKLVETKYFFINSINRDIGTNSDFTVYIPPNIISNNNNNSKKYLRVSLYSLTINYEWYNIMTGHNNSFEYYDGSSTTTITIPDGSYSVYQLRDELTTLLSTYTVTYNLITNKFTFTSTDGTATITPTNCGSLLGLDDGTIYTGTFSSAYPVNMQYESTIYLNCDLASSAMNLDNINSERTSTSTILDKIPISTAPFDNIIYFGTNPSTIDIALNDAFLSSLRFWITTNRGRRLSDLKQPWELCLTFQIYES